jgi:hypothetical protein
MISVLGDKIPNFIRYEFITVEFSWKSFYYYLTLFYYFDEIFKQPISFELYISIHHIYSVRLATFIKILL